MVVLGADSPTTIDVPFFYVNPFVPFQQEVLTMTGMIDRSKFDVSSQSNLTTKSLVLIDANVSDLAVLLSDLSAASNAIVVNRQTDGIAQITAALEAYPELSTVHLISHGEPGCLHLGTSRLSFETLEQYEQELRSWAKYLQGKELLLYGCNVAQGALGHLFIQQLHQLTGAAIAASPLPVGSTEQGAQWTLSHQLGTIQSAIAFSETLQQTYAGQFAAPVFEGTSFPSFSTPEDGELTVLAADGVLADVTDADGDVLRVNLADIPQNGGILLDPEDGSFVYTPNPGFVGVETFSYTVTDGTNTTGPITVTIQVGNQAPVLPTTTPTYAVEANGSLVVSEADGVLNGVSDPDGDSLQILLSQNPANGGILISPTNGSFTYTPNPGFVGTEFFSYTVTDGTVTSDPIPVTIAVGEITNEAPNTPVPTPTYGAPADQPFTVAVADGVLNGVTDPEGDPISIALADIPQNGGILIDPNDGSFTYTPNAGFAGTETFSYTITDGINTTAPVPVSIEVSQPPVGPTTNPTFSTTVGNSLTVLPADGVLNDITDPDGDTLRINLADAPQNGELLLNPEDGSFTYTPNPGFEGTETFSYTVTDGINTSAPIPVSIEVAAGSDNLPPTTPDPTPTYGAPADQPLTVSVADGVLDGVTDPEGDPISIALADIPQNGGILIDPNDGSFTYTPNAGFAGTETFSYTITDGINTTAPVPVSITVSQAPVGLPTDLTFSTTEDNSLTVLPADGVLNGITDPDGDPLSIALADIPQNGGILIDPNDGSLTYTPNPGFVGTETFSYTVTDGINTSAPIPVAINVAGDGPVPNQPPTLPGATPTYDAVVDQPLTVTPNEGVLEGVTDPEGDPLSINLADIPQNGGILIDPNDGSFTYTPNPGFVGTETFSYTVTDGVNTTAPIPVTIEVAPTPVNQPPTLPDATPTYGAPADQLFVVFADQGVLKGVTDPEGDTLRIALADIPQNGGLNISPDDGSFLYQPNPGFAGIETFSYTVTDGINTSEPIPVTIEVSRPPVVPATTPTYSTTIDTPLDVAPSDGVLDGITDPDGDTLSINLADAPQNGSILLDPDTGSFVYTPNPGFAGTETFTYTVTDGINTSEPIPVSIDIAGKDPNRLSDVFINFDASTIGELPAGTVITDQFSDVGLTISTPFNEFGAMIFDSANPTGGDFDLSSETQGNVLIISEDGDSSDPDDEMFGGTIRFEWDSLVNVENADFLDIGQDGGTVELFGIDGALIQSFEIPNLGNDSEQVLTLGVSDVARMDVNFANSGAVASLMWEGRGVADIATGLPGNLDDC